MEPLIIFLARFPWIVWFLWKARNEKIFNGKQVLPPDTELHATQEEENWRVAQVIEKKDTTGDFRLSNGRNLENDSQLPRCQVDASWVTNSTVSGGGFVFDLAPEIHTYGSLGMDHVLSPMHAEVTYEKKGLCDCAFTGMSELRFKPAYNPYTEPSMEIFSYHAGLKKWVEIGNSGMFRPEMLQPMGLPEDVRVVAWGLSLERPTMILYKCDNIRELFGHNVQDLT
ncbi:hypothetical protein IGI04_023255 [Brassica rapa subsp. trilocularis]|uniref:phenylalanine--tRNA ligase n=1 Tax=Brassica rapa subsp. trilocularis TaxID=1813537 RepID=A0ABQ7M3C1_BRACM|nr:hypothetical protein IGI04_023255 [Brassica rapa subsp. trilocularis]